MRQNKFKKGDIINNLIILDKDKIITTNNGVVNNKITFSSSYYCYNLLPKDIIMEKIEKEKESE